ncbi:hypothetical protein [Dyella sp.]|jgi:hypothetical protein|uniref:hypothetical protein n=1 Tax=Dyella sp. TaxID=1869338 RepID=UPI002FDB5B2E
MFETLAAKAARVFCGQRMKLAWDEIPACLWRLMPGFHPGLQERSQAQEIRLPRYTGAHVAFAS